MASLAPRGIEVDEAFFFPFHPSLFGVFSISGFDGYWLHSPGTSAQLRFTLHQILCSSKQYPTVIMVHAPFNLAPTFELHESKNTAGSGYSRPNGKKILEDENRLDGSPVDRLVVITGCSSGIGVPTVEAMAAGAASNQPALARRLCFRSSKILRPRTK